MLRWFPPLAALTALALTLCADPAAAAGGGARFGDAPAVLVAKARGGTAFRHGPRRPVATLFSAVPTGPAGAPVDFTFRIDAQAPAAQVRIEVIGPAGRGPIGRLGLGRQATGRRLQARWAPAVGLVLPAGSYRARLHVVDTAGNRLARTARRAGQVTIELEAAPVRVFDGLFPVGGAFELGGEDARFGAQRPGHVHEGQDITAAAGTPVIVPRAGVVTRRAYHERGAGHYLVIRDAQLDREYVFMHLQGGSLLVRKDNLVLAGQTIASVGSSGRTSGPHLHFEIWEGGWRIDGGRPIDPRPELDAWVAAPSA